MFTSEDLNVEESQSARRRLRGWELAAAAALVLAVVGGGGGLIVQYRSHQGRQERLALAITVGNLVEARALLAEGVRLAPQDPEILLRNSVVNGPLPAAELLLELGTGVDQPYAEEGMGWTPLMVAAQFRTPDGVRFLLQRGANPHRRDKRGLRPIDLLRADIAAEKSGGAFHGRGDSGFTRARTVERLLLDAMRRSEPDRRPSGVVQR